MNDATRELGSALGVAVMGSLAASKYTSAVASATAVLPAAAQDAAKSSLAGALAVSQRIPGATGAQLAGVASNSFISGVHLAMTVAAVLTWTAALVVLRFLPRQMAHEGAMHGAADAVEDVLQLGIAGVEPVFADEPFVGDERLGTSGAPA